VSTSVERLRASRGALRRVAATARSGLAKPAVVVGGTVAVSATVAAVFSLEVVRYEPDELGYTHLAIGIAHSMSPLTTSYGGAQRLNQLYPLLIAPLWGLFGNVTAFRVTHVWNAILMASAAIPAYLLAWEVVRVRWAAYLVAALVAVAPWITLSTAELTEVAAYPACTWALLAMQRGLLVPSARRDVVALVAIGVAAYGRLQLILLAPAFVLAVLVHEMGFRLTSREETRFTVRETALRMARQHPVLAAASAIGLLVGLPLLLTGRLASAAGFYGNSLSGATFNSATFDLARSYLTFIALGLGAVPAALTLGFVMQTVVAPVSRRAHAFASLVAIVVIALTLQVAEVSVRFTGGTLQERYLFYLAPLLAVGMCAALLSTRRPAVTVLAGSVALALLVATTRYPSARSAFWYQVSPGTMSFYDWLFPALGAPSGATAAADPALLLPTGEVVLGLGLVLALLLRRLAPPSALVVVGVLAIGFCAVETTHALWRTVNGTSNGIGLGSGSLRDVDWVNRAVPAGASVMQLEDNVGGIAAAFELWQDNAFWNRSVTGAYTVDAFSVAYLPTMPFRVSPSSGSIRSGTASSVSDARYIVLPTRGFSVVPTGDVLARSPDRALELMRVALPLRAAWTVSGVSPDGWFQMYRGGAIRLYALRGATGRCATVSLTVSLDAVVSSPRVLVTSAGGAARRTTLEPGRTQTVRERVCSRRVGVPAVSFQAEEPVLPDHEAVTPRLVKVTATLT
jgi:hypothetical protein